MTSRERFHEVLAYGHPDRVPLWKESLRDGVRELWITQGLPKEVDLSRLFRFDPREEIILDLRPYPPFDDPSEGPEVFVRLRSHYYPDPSRLPPDWRLRARGWARRDYPLGMSVWRGLFQSLGVENWQTLRRALFALADVPSVMIRTLGAFTDCAVQMVEHALTAVALDYAIFEEPIAGAGGPVISPGYFRRFCMPFYRRLVDLLRTRGVRWFVVRTYANALALIPCWLECGINVLWCMESISTGVNYEQLRREYGRQLRLIGGISLDALSEGKEAIDHVVYGPVSRLLDEGGYLPLIDGKIRHDVPWQNYRYYREVLERLVFSKRSPL